MFSVLCSTSFFGQEKPKEEFQPVFLAATTVHRSTDPNVDFTDWLKTEKEYFDKVTRDQVQKLWDFSIMQKLLLV